jgi:sugar lactone lactonase YvrE
MLIVRQEHGSISRKPPHKNQILKENNIVLRKLVFVMIAALVLAAPAFAQDQDVVTDGLSFPRGITVDTDGTIWIAEAGSGGETVLMDTDEMTATAGLSGQITTVAPDGTKSVALGNFLSVFNSGEGAGVGLYRVYPHAESLWIVVTDVPMPGLFTTANIIELDKTSLRAKNYIDTRAYEEANNTDGTEEINSNPGDIAWDASGNLYVLDTGANALFTWTPEDGLAPFIVWNDNPVPTSIEFADDGTLWIGFLGTEIAPGAGHIEHWSADGQTLIGTFSGLTAVSDIALGADGSVYATQLITGFGEQGPEPGNVVKVTAEGATPLAEGLWTPFGLAWDAEGNLLVTTGTAFAEPGSGTVVRVPVA